jgi:hypothetical protein
MISLNQQIEEVAREIEMRERVYPHLVSSGKMRQSHADYHQARLRAVLKTLQWLAANEKTIKQAIGSGT